MNKLKILCFILSIEFFTSILPKQNFVSTFDDFKNCQLLEDTTKCKELPFHTQRFQCCHYKSEEKGIEMCSANVKPINLAIKELETEAGKLLTKEYGGYYMFQNDSEIQFTDYYFDCSDGKLNYKFDANNYTDEERKKYKSKNYCRYYSNAEYEQENITREVCHKALIAIDGKSLISCGYAEFQLNFNDSSTKVYKTCILFNEDILTTKNIGLWTKMTAEDDVNQEARKYEKEGEVALSSYTMTVTNSKEKYYTYYSSNDTVVVGEPNNGNDSKFLGINLFLLILFLF